MYDRRLPAVLLWADLHSPHTHGWLKNLKEAGHRVVVMTSRQSTREPLPSGVKVYRIQGRVVCELSLDASPVSGLPQTGALLRRFLVNLANTRLGHAVWATVMACRARRASKAVVALADRECIDLVHALRVTFEGVQASLCGLEIPLVLSVWGNDFTLHTRKDPVSRWLVGRALGRADGLAADCYRDIRIARRLGLGEKQPTVVAPGGGGIGLECFDERTELSSQIDERDPTPVLVNPRGLRAYVDWKAFLVAIRFVKDLGYKINVLMTGVDGDPFVMSEVRRLDLGEYVTLLPHLSQPELHELFSRCDIVVSPTYHDGTPNSLLEAMAHGAFPIASRLESIAEWIEHGVNGFLFEPVDPNLLAHAIVVALRSQELQVEARRRNHDLLRRRATREFARAELSHLYERVLADVSCRR